MPLRRLMLPFLFALAAIALPGCGDSASNTNAGGNTAGPATNPSPPSGQVGAELRFICNDEHNTLDPQRMSWLMDIRIAECMFETLCRSKVPELTQEPAAAAKWDISDDGLTYTFHLRPDAKWSNGDPVTAGDFVFAWRRMMSPDFAADYSQLFFRIAGAEEFFNWRIEQLKAYAASGRAGREAAAGLWRDAERRFAETVGVRAADERTLVVTLARPTAYFIELAGFISFTPLHEKSVAAATTVDATTGMLQQDATYWADPARLVCNGPYRLESRRPGATLRMLANPHYWNRAALRNPGVTELIVKDTQAQLLTYSSGKADWLPEVPTAQPIAADLIAAQQAGKRGDVIATPWAGTYFYNFNCLPELPGGGGKNPLADARVRRALSMGFNRETIVTRVTRLRQPVARTFTPPGALHGYEPPIEAGVTFDPEGAKRLLAEAGYPGGGSLQGLSIIFNTGQGHEHIAAQIKRDWQETLGVTVALEPLDLQTFKDRMKRQQYTISRANWIGDYPDPTTFLDKCVSGNGNNDAAYRNPEYDALMREAAEQLDAGQRLATLRRAEAMMLADQPIAPIYHLITIQVYDPAKVQGLHPNIWNQRRLEFVYVKP